MQMTQSRRAFLACLSAAGAAGLLDPRTSLADEPPPETTAVRFAKYPRAVCEAPKYLAEELLRAEGFTDIRYLEPGADTDSYVLMTRGELDFDSDFAPPLIASIEGGRRIAVLAGLHSGCLELIANEDVHSVTDLRGKKVGVFSQNSAPHVLVTLMAAYVGLDPVNDIHWVTNEKATAMELFAEGRIDAFLGIPPEPQEMRARKIGHTIVNSTVDQPWSQYFCCMFFGSADYVTRYPVATKRVLRAVLKAVDICRSQPTSAARSIVDNGIADQYGYALQGLTEARYHTWREYDPEDTLRFYALRMHEAGLIKSSPNTIISEGTDWRLLNELKRELKA